MERPNSESVKVTTWRSKPMPSMARLNAASAWLNCRKAGSMSCISCAPALIPRRERKRLRPLRRPLRFERVVVWRPILRMRRRGFSLEGSRVRNGTENFKPLNMRFHSMLLPIHVSLVLRKNRRTPDWIAMQISRRPLTADDEAFIKRLIEDVVADELGARLWPDAVRVTLLDTQYRARRAGYRDAFPDAAEEIVQRDGEAAGWLVTARDAESIRVVDIAVLAQERGKGLGTACIRDLQAEAERTARLLRLSVVRMTAAARLYERLGFQVTGGDEIRYAMEWRARPIHVAE
jgi:GNAT superfamily N-acetyltransferase